MKRSLRSGSFRGALCVAGLVAFSVVACSSDETGTDIEVGGKTGTAGSAGKNGQSSAGTSSASGGTSNDGGATDGGAGAGEGGDVGVGGSSGGSGGKGGADGISGSGGAAGKAGSSGSGGSAGSGGNAGAGTAGASGSAGHGGNGGNGGSAGNAGSGGKAGSGGTAGGPNQDCGNGSVEGTEECDDSGPSRLCSDSCETVSTPACVECEQAGDCFASSDNCKGPAATPFNSNQVAVCYDVLQCIQDSNCLDAPSGSLGKCYCGTLGTAACGAAPFDLSKPGAPNGPCAELMQLGYPEATTNSQILGGVTTKSRPMGAAGQRLNCQRVSAEPACAALCGLE
jgi:hypothetical protein